MDRDNQSKSRQGWYRSTNARGYMGLAKLFAKWSRNAYRLAVAIDPEVKR